MTCFSVLSKRASPGVVDFVHMWIAHIPARRLVAFMQAFVVNPPLVILRLYRQQNFVVTSRPSRRISMRNCSNLVRSMSYSVDRLESVCALSVDCIKAKCIYSSGVVFRVPNFFEHH